MYLPPGYEVVMKCTHGISSAYWVSLFCLMIVATLAIFQVWVGVGVFLGGSGICRCCATCIRYPLASESYSKRIRKLSWNYSSQCGVILLCKVLQNITSVLVAVFIRVYSSVIRNIASIPVYNFKATLLDCMQQKAIQSVAKHLHICWLCHRFTVL
jgi:hypothetical protein